MNLIKNSYSRNVMSVSRLGVSNDLDTLYNLDLILLNARVLSFYSTHMFSVSYSKGEYRG